MMSLRRRMPASEHFADTIRRTLASLPDGVDPRFLSYHGALRTDSGLRRYCRARWQLVSLAGGVHGRNLVDAGSGFGVGANLFGSWGARRVYAVELSQPMIESHGRVLRRDFSDVTNVRPIRADCSAMPMANRSVDLVVSIETISHYFDVAAFLD